MKTIVVRGTVITHTQAIEKGFADCGQFLTSLSEHPLDVASADSSVVSPDVV